MLNLQFEMLYNDPYKYTSDEVLFSVYAIREAIPDEAWDKAKQSYFSKGQRCFRASPLHKNMAGEYNLINTEKLPCMDVKQKNTMFLADASVKKVKAMRSNRR